MSDRIRRALCVLDLLQHRYSVSMKTLVRETGVTERTVYRILRSLSEANIPVYLDQASRGYRLNSSSRRPLELSLHELTLVMFALDQLSTLAGSAYVGIIAEVCDKLVRCHPFELDDILNNGHNPDNIGEGLSSIGASLSLALVSVAMDAHYSVEVHLCGIDGGERCLSLEAPSLVYKTPEWLLADKGNATRISMSSVKAVRITNDAPLR